MYNPIRLFFSGVYFGAGPFFCLFRETCTETMVADWTEKPILWMNANVYAIYTISLGIHLKSKINYEWIWGKKSQWFWHVLYVHSTHLIQSWIQSNIWFLGIKCLWMCVCVSVLYTHADYIVLVRLISKTLQNKWVSKKHAQANEVSAVRIEWNWKVNCFTATPRRWNYLFDLIRYEYTEQL